MQQPPLGTSHLILGDTFVRVLQNMRTSWITTVLAFGGATIAHLYRLVELMIQEGAAVACAKWRDALFFIRFMLEQVSVPALNTCVKMLKEGDE